MSQLAWRVVGTFLVATFGCTSSDDAPAPATSGSVDSDASTPTSTPSDASKPEGSAPLTCNTGHADCDGQLADGCETDLASAHDHCGACGYACTSAQVCSAGSCSSSCHAGLVACGGGCVDVASNPAHCGACATGCPGVANGSATCTQSQCGVACNSGFELSGGACVALPSHILLFGGTNRKAASATAANYFGDTWSWNGSSWTQLNVTGPSAREGSVMATLGTNSVTLYGGRPVWAGGALDSNVWNWNGTAWNQTPQDQSLPIRALEYAAMATLNGKVFQICNGSMAVWDGGAWTNLNIAVPPARYASAMATLNGRILLFGGRDATALVDLSDTWEFDGHAWTQRMVAGPAAREGHAMAVLGGKTVLFGGNATNDTWEWDGSTWTQRMVVGPPARSFSAMASAGGKVILFGGASADLATQYQDTWAWDGSAWTQLPVNGPSTRFGHAMAAY